MSKSFSIIIPHRDCPDLLQRCLDSIPVREDVQVIVVDDNSDPSIVDFERFPGKDRDGVEIIFTKEGKGAGYARNIGLDHSQGKWLIFLDSDDFFLPSITEVFEDEINTEEDIVFYRPRFVFSDNLDKVSTRGGSEYNSFIDRYFETGWEIDLRTKWHSPWSKLIKRSLVVEKGIRFEETKYSNDVLFSVSVGCKANRIVARDKCFCVVTEREGALTSRFCQKEGELVIRASSFFRSQMVIKDLGFPIDEKLAFRFLRRLFNTDRNQFKTFFKTFLELSDHSRKYLIDGLFENNRLASRIKRKVYAYLVSLF